MENKKITIIIIGNDNIEGCLNKINEQSYVKDMELLVLYKENKKEEIERISSLYKNVKFIVYESNIFKILHQNKQGVTGEYISILNSEDDLTVDYYRTMVSKAIFEDADIVMSNAVLQYNDGGKAYLNFSESTLRDLENEQILEEYLRQEGLSFLWSIYGNKVYKKELFFKVLEELNSQNIEIQNFYFFTVLFYYSKKLRIVNNEVLFYSFEKNEAKETIRKFLQNRYDEDEIYNNTINNFELMEKFLYKKEIEIKINNWKDVYLNKSSLIKKDLITKVKTAWNDNLDKIKKEIIKEETKVVSFDIFDTLIMRPFWNPIDLFEFLNDYFRQIAKIETGIDFSKLRVKAEEILRKKLENDKSSKQEITLDEIYKEIMLETNISDEISKKMQEKEIELELRFCTERKTGKELYQLAKYLNKKIICISDMYLPINTINEILKKNNYEFEEIYLSNEIKLTKFKSDLYKYVINDLKIETENIVHVGDNYYSDYENAIKVGINAQFLPKAIDVFCNENITNNLGKLFKENLPFWQNTSNGLNFIGIRCMLAVVANKYFDNPYRTFNNSTDFNVDPNFVGYYVLGMHLFGITDWLLKDVEKNKYENVVFFARDGYWIMKAYQILKEVYQNAPNEKYLYISRRALIYATLQNRFDFYKLSELIDIYKYTPKTILKYIKDIVFNLDNLENECNKRGININENFKNKNEFNIYMNLIIEKFYNENEHLRIVKALKEYFLGVFSGNACAFDIGYSAKPEMYLSKLCDKSIDTYFINISNDESYKHAQIGNFKLNTYFDYRPAITGVVREIFMSTADPSCIGYEVNEESQVKPIFEDKNQDYQHRFVIDTMQNGAMNFIKDLVNIFKEDIKKLYYQKYYISLPHEMFINSANEVDQEIFNSVDFEDAVGLGDKIDAIEEWDREMKEKNQKRAKELFDIKLVDRLRDKIKDLEDELKIKENEKEKILEENNRQKIEIEQIYNSKRWKCFDKIDKIMGRKK